MPASVDVEAGLFTLPNLITFARLCAVPAAVWLILQHRLDIAFLGLAQADREGNLRYRFAARNFNPLVATAGRLTIAEAELVLDDFLAPDDVHTPGIFVQRVVAVADPTKDIEQRTVRSRSEGI